MQATQIPPGQEDHVDQTQVSQPQSAREAHRAMARTLMVLAGGAALSMSAGVHHLFHHLVGIVGFATSVATFGVSGAYLTATAPSVFLQHLIVQNDAEPAQVHESFLDRDAQPAKEGLVEDVPMLSTVKKIDEALHHRSEQSAGA